MNTYPKRILIVAVEPDIQVFLNQPFLQQPPQGSYEVIFVSNEKQAEEAIFSDNSICLVVVVPSSSTILSLTSVRNFQRINPAINTILIAENVNHNVVRLAMHAGVFDLLSRPIDFNDLENTINMAIVDFYERSEKYRSQQVVHQAHFEIEESLKSAQFKQQFLANMSHEIRTPLNAIVGMTNLLLQNNPREDQLRYLTSMLQASDNLLGLVNDILDISKIEAGRIVLDQVDFNIHERIIGVYNTLHLLAEKADILFDYRISDKIPQWLIGDPVRLSQILTNLTSNAIKFTPHKGHVQIQADLLEREEDKILVAIRISDTGIGISKEQQEKIFESFTQASSDTTRKYGGTGLGLSISKHLVDLQQGTIQIESEVGKGTTFTVILPYLIGKEIIPETPALEVDFSNRPLQLLLAEDQPMNQMVAVDTIESLFPKAHVDVAENGQQAVEMAQSKKYDLIFMDIHMPVMDGYDATRTIISGSGLSSKSPIIALTANVIKEEIDKCMEVGMLRHIAKPFTPEQLKTVIQDLA